MRWSGYLALGVCTLLAVLARGYSFGKEDQNLYLPFVMHWMDPSLFPHDHLLALGYARESVVWGLLAVAGRLVPLQVLLLVLYVACSYLVLLVVFKTARAWWGNNTAAWIAVFLWMPAYQVPGVANTTFDDYFTTRILGTLFALLALYAMAEKKDLAAALFLFIGGLCHIISMAPVTGGMALAHLAKRRWRALRLALLGSLAAVAVLYLLSTFAGQHHNLFQRYDGSWGDLVHRVDSELFPQRWPRGAWIRVILYPCFLGILLSARRKEPEGRTRVSDAAWLCAGVLIGEAAGLAGALSGIAILVQLCLFRGQWIILFLLAMVLAGTLGAALEEAGHIRALTVLASATLWVTGDWILQAAAVLLSVCLVKTKEIVRMRHWVMARREHQLSTLLGLFGVTVLWQAGRLLGWWYPSLWAPDRRAMIGALVSAFLLAAALAWISRAKRRFVAELVPAAFLLQLALVPSTFLVGQLKEYKAFRKLYGPVVAHQVVQSAAKDRQAATRATVGEMVRRNVPKDAVVVVPPDWMDFRLVSQRSPFITYKDGAPAEFDPGYAVLWLQRIRQVHGLIDRPGTWIREPSLDLSREEVLQLAMDNRSIHLEYLVTPKTYDLPLIGEASGFRLYRIGGGFQ